MGWTEMQSADRSNVPMTAEKEQELSKARDESLPTVKSEVAQRKDLEPVSYQEVRGPKCFEGEFGVKGKDVIFHVWPHGYHAADADGRALPRFPSNFEQIFRQAMETAFSAHRVELSYDGDVGAWFAKATEYGDHMHHRDLSIRVFQKLYTLMGGVEG